MTAVIGVATGTSCVDQGTQFISPNISDYTLEQIDKNYNQMQLDAQNSQTR